LCHVCRTELVKRTVPLWIKGTALLIVILLLYSLIQFPLTLKAGIHYKRGVQAYTNHKSWTAVHEFEQATDRFPDSTKILARLYISYYQTSQLDKAAQVLSRIGGKAAESESMANLINNVASEMDRRYYSDKELQEVDSEPDLNIRITKLRDYISKHPESVPGQYYLADSLYDAKQFNEVESIVLKLRETETDYEAATLLLAAAYRETKQYDKATNEVQSVLSSNSESDRAYFSLSRIEFKQHMDEQGLVDAQTAYDLNPDDGSNIANLALAHFYSKNMAERDRLVSLLQGREDYGQKELDQLNAIFNGTTPWRD
jgi:thioredoxin-like negative regulator of GroEL